MVYTKAGAFDQSVASYPMTLSSIATLPRPLPKTSVLTPSWRSSHILPLAWKMLFNILRVGIFLAIVLWPWETAE